MRIVIRPDGRENIYDCCGAERETDVADIIGLHRGQIGKVLGGKHLPGNKFIAGVIEECGLQFAFEHIFAVAEDTE